MRLTASVVLAAMLLACGGGGDSGPEGSAQVYCHDYAQEKTESYEPGDAPLIPGIFTVGLAKGTTRIEANTFLKSLETGYYILLPYAEVAIVCVKDGYEEQWVEQLKQYPEVEWAHREGVRPLAAAD